MTTDERLSALERELAMTRRRLRWALALAGAGLGLFAVSDRPGGTRGAYAQEPVPEVIRARRIEAVDENGKTRAVLGAFDEGPSLVLQDVSGEIRAELSANKAGNEGPELSLNDENGKPRAVLGAHAGGTALDLSDEKGKFWSTPARK